MASLISLTEKIAAIFRRDKLGYWFGIATNYERTLSKMSLTELAGELERAKVCGETANSIVVEHTLSTRLARIQSRASWWSAWLGFSGAMLAAALTFYLGQRSAEHLIKPECIPAQSGSSSIKLNTK